MGFEEIKIEIELVDMHRNGVCGEPFHVIKFIDRTKSNKNANMMAVVYSEPGYVSVFNRDALGEGEVRFFYNSWRGDNYEGVLRQAIEEWRDGFHRP